MDKWMEFSFLAALFKAIDTHSGNGTLPNCLCFPSKRGFTPFRVVPFFRKS